MSPKQMRPAIGLQHEPVESGEEQRVQLGDEAAPTPIEHRARRAAARAVTPGTVAVLG